MAAASWAIQRALHQTLTAHAPLMAAVTGIFDYVPGGQPLPYVTVGEAVETDGGAACFPARDHRISIHVWSGHAGMAEAKHILGLIDEALEHMPADLTGHRLLSLRFLSARVLAEADNIRHGIADYRARTVREG